MKPCKQGMRAFNLEQAIAGKPIVCRDGTPAKFLYYCEEIEGPFKVGALVDGGAETFQKDGRFYSDKKEPYDLFMASEKKSGWINIYKSSCPETLAFTGGGVSI